jgi:hypothetical protein
MSVLSHKGVLRGVVIPGNEGQLVRAGRRLQLDQSRRESRWKRHLGQIADAAAARISAAFDMPVSR